ncbi:MAG: hypothetical protein R2710_27155 [Acidimicrobiales bacterium]
MSGIANRPSVGNRDAARPCGGNIGELALGWSDTVASYAALVPLLVIVRVYV